MALSKGSYRTRVTASSAPTMGVRFTFTMNSVCTTVSILCELARRCASARKGARMGRKRALSMPTARAIATRRLAASAVWRVSHDQKAWSAAGLAARVLLLGFRQPIAEKCQDRHRRHVRDQPRDHGQPLHVYGRENPFASETTPLGQTAASLRNKGRGSAAARQARGKSPGPWTGRHEAHASKKQARDNLGRGRAIEDDASTRQSNHRPPPWRQPAQGVCLSASAFCRPWVRHSFPSLIGSLNRNGRSPQISERFRQLGHDLRRLAFAGETCNRRKDRT